MIDQNAETRAAWDANAAVWDEKMGDEGNGFFRILCWPAMVELLNLQTGQRILDIACGNGLTSRKLAALGAEVTAFDFSANLIELARGRSAKDAHQIDYHVTDATDEAALLQFGEKCFDAAFSNMALFDIADIDPLFHALPSLLKPGGIFVFSITHPAFNNASSVHVAEERDDEGTLFQNGFVLDGFAERAFPPDTPQNFPLAWGGNFSEIPPAIVLRLRLLPRSGSPR
jgi:2-polyprenyl-3-methyl-5-hydroxy-6-metoxy-1,4-benzoquinol methylase